MSNEMANAAREAFLIALQVGGTDCDVLGEPRRALKRENKKPGFTVFQFADEFSLRAGDEIRENAIETHFAVVEAEAISKGGGFFCLEVTADRIS